MNKCRTDATAYHDPDDVLPELTARQIRDKIDDFWLWGKATDQTMVIIQSAFEVMMDDEKARKDFFYSLSIQKDRFPQLRDSIETFVREEIEAGNLWK